MSRAEKDVVAYFPHDATASHGNTLTILQNRFGNNGYAVWFKLLEKLASSNGHSIDISKPLKWQLLVAQFGTDEITTVEILKLLVEIEAIDKSLFDSGVIWCQNLVDNVASVYANRRRKPPEKPLTTNKKRITTDRNALTTDDNPQSKVEYSRVNKSKCIYAHFEEFWKSYPNKKSKPQAERAFAKINPSEELLAMILAGLEKAKKSRDWQKDGGQFIPHPATWLNNRRWEDEINDKGTDNQPSMARRSSHNVPTALELARQAREKGLE